jgi:hypothetical protein
VYPRCVVHGQDVVSQSTDESELLAIFTKMAEQNVLPGGGAPQNDESEEEVYSEGSREILRELEDGRDPVMESAELEGLTTTTCGSQSALYSRYKRCLGR